MDLLSLINYLKAPLAGLTASVISIGGAVSLPPLRPEAQLAATAEVATQSVASMENVKAFTLEIDKLDTLHPDVALWSKEFYDKYPGDVWDFITFFTNKESSQPGFLSLVRLEKGLGQSPVVINPAEYGSAGHLRGVAFLPVKIPDPVSGAGIFDLLLEETFAHSFGVYIGGPAGSSQVLPVQNSTDPFHWSRCMSFPKSPADSVYYWKAFHWKDNGNGTWTREDVSLNYYNDMLRLDPFMFYFAGLLSPEQVPDATLLLPVSGNEQDCYTNTTIQAASRTISVQDVINAYGPRVPSFAQSQKEFATALVLLTQKGQTPSPIALDRLDRISKEWPAMFRKTTTPAFTLKTSSSPVTNLCVRGAPKIVEVVPPTGTSVPRNDKVTASVQNADSYSCGSSDFKMEVTSSLPFQFQPATVSLLPVQKGGAGMQITLASDSTLKSGTYKVPFDIVNMQSGLKAHGEFSIQVQRTSEAEANLCVPAPPKVIKIALPGGKLISGTNYSGSVTIQDLDSSNCGGGEFTMHISDSAFQFHPKTLNLWPDNPPGALGIDIMPIASESGTYKIPFDIVNVQSGLKAHGEFTTSVLVNPVLQKIIPGTGVVGTKLTLIGDNFTPLDTVRISTSPLDNKKNNTISRFLDVKSPDGKTITFSFPFVFSGGTAPPPGSYVVQVFADDEDSTPTAEISFQLVQGICGDVNGDGQANSLDISLVRRHILGFKALDADKAALADVNHDGNVNTLDVVLLRRHILGIDTAPLSCSP